MQCNSLCGSYETVRVRGGIPLLWRGETHQILAGRDPSRKTAAVLPHALWCVRVRILSLLRFLYLERCLRVQLVAIRDNSQEEEREQPIKQSLLTLSSLTPAPTSRRLRGVTRANTSTDRDNKISSSL